MSFEAEADSEPKWDVDAEKWISNIETSKLNQEKESKKWVPHLSFAACSKLDIGSDQAPRL